MGVASGCGEQEVGVASGSGWNLWVWQLVDFISRDEPDSPLTQYITNAGISRARYIITNFKTRPSCFTADFQSNECINIAI